MDPQNAADEGQQKEDASVRKLLDRVEDLRGDGSHFGPAFDLTPFTAMRFLRARDGDVDKAERMFRDAYTWRMEFGVAEKVNAWRAELAAQKTDRARVCKEYWFGGACASP